MQLFQTYLIVGDAAGCVRVYNCGDMSLLMEGWVRQGIQPHQASITTITVLEKLGAPVIVAGDKSGFISLIQQQQNGVGCFTFGAYADKKQSDPRVERVF